MSVKITSWMLVVIGRGDVRRYGPFNTEIDADTFAQRFGHMYEFETYEMEKPE